MSTLTLNPNLSLPIFHDIPTSSNTSKKESLLRRIKGSRIFIPDLYQVLPGWKHDMNEGYPSMRDEIDNWLLSWVRDETERRRIIRADFASLAACLYPKAQPEEYRAMALYHGWIFIWDDVIDDGTLDDPKLAQYHRETCDTISWCMGPKPFVGPCPPTNGIMSSFIEIAKTIVPNCSQYARERIHNELQAYINTATWLQSKRQGEILSMKEHIEQRNQSSGIFPSIALLEYIHGLDLPPSVINHEAMQVIINKTCLIIHLLNDIVSFPKELADNQVDNLIPLLVHHENLSTQEAILRACELVRQAHLAFVDAERRLPVNGNIRTFVQGCKDLATGAVHWSYLSARYYGKNPIREGYKTFMQL
ncbi:hypothetical protein JAAARDRAFT_62046 [Jaapia argillacea MUCL 33604]|uniref:Terpene synthase n=1 Tax=Jaapia argillacea MUCL 33604 TaxID=933084 RepID=A0A067PM63_9AGAM|nr:hypothetical protein JAAARDRAFT_62046 [Jaapia argillacea MUCL 33604]